MATLSDYMSGTISLANGSVTVTGTGTLFEVTRFREGDTLQIQNLTAVIASVDSDTQLTLAEPWTGLDIVNGAYRARQLGDGTRVSTQAATIIELLGNGVLMNLAELGVEEGKVPVGGPTGEYELKDLVTDPNGSLEKLAALTLAANKILNTDASAELTQSDITAAAIVLLKLAGTADADKLPYFDGANSAALTDLTAQARTMLASTTPAVTSLGYTPINKAGDSNIGNLSTVGNVTVGGVLQTNGGNGLQARVNRPSSPASGSPLWAPTITSNWGASKSDGPAARFYMREIVDQQVAGCIEVQGWGTNAAVLVFTEPGNLQVPGTLSKGAGTFLIDHPLDPYNRNLRHGFVEAPRYDLIYRGVAQLLNGRATVDIDTASNMTSGTFAALTTNAVVACLQNQDGFDRLKPGPIIGGWFEIVCEDDACTDLVSWVVLAERNDPFVKSELDENTDSNGRFVPDFEKEDA